MDNERFALTVAELCAKLPMGRSTFYSLKKRGKAPEIIKVGRRTLITISAVERWIKQLEDQRNA